MKLIFDIETDDLDATRVWCIIAKELDGKVYKFGPNQIEEGINFLQNATEPVSYTHLTLPTKA